MDWKLEVVIIAVTDMNGRNACIASRWLTAVNHDTRMSDEMRIVQLTPRLGVLNRPGAVDCKLGTRIALKGVQLIVPDIEDDRAKLVERGMEVSEVQHFDGGVQVAGRGGDWNSFIFFSDPDGNAWTSGRPAPDPVAWAGNMTCSRRTVCQPQRSEIQCPGQSLWGMRVSGH